MKLSLVSAILLLSAAPAAFAQVSTVTPDQNGAAAMPAATPSPTATDVTQQTVASAPVPDTKANRAKYPPLSHAGKASNAAGN